MALGPRLSLIFTSIRGPTLFLPMDTQHHDTVSSLWHKRLRHLSKADITHLFRSGYIPQTLLLGPSVLRALPLWQIGSRITPDISTERIEPLDLVHSDICGPMPHQSLDGASYFVSFIEDSTRNMWAYSIRTEDRVFSIFSECFAMVENQSGRKLKCLRTNNMGEFKSEEFVKYCRERGIRREYTAAYSPEQNGIAEHMNRTIQ